MKTVLGVLAAVGLSVAAFGQSADFTKVVQTGSAAEVQAAIDAGANAKLADRIGLTPLAYAARFNADPSVLTVLLKAGADVDAREPILGVTPLMLAAAWNRNVDVVATLLRAHAAPDLRDKNGRTALIWGAWHGTNSDVIKALLDGGADASIKDASGRTALDYAKSNRSLRNSSAIASLSAPSTK